MKQLEHKDVVSFTTAEELSEYVYSSNDLDFLEGSYKQYPSLLDFVLTKGFPQIHSKHWCIFLQDKNAHNQLEIKKDAIDRLITYHEYKTNTMGD